MPCYTPEPTARQRHLNHVAELCLMVGESLNITIPPEIVVQAGEYFTSDVGQTEWLCSTITNLKADNPERFETLVYNARDADSRKLADWWDKHEEQDQRRRMDEEREERRKVLREQLLAKMSPEEIEVFGRYIQ